MTEEVNVNIINQKAGVFSHIIDFQIFNLIEDYSYKLLGRNVRKKKYANHYLN